jgi:hypothetical protein
VRYRIRWRGNEWASKYKIEIQYKWWPFWFLESLAGTYEDALIFVNKHKNRDTYIN